MRQSAIVGMGRSCDERWIKYLLAELESNSHAMRYEAAWACGELGLPRAVSYLARLVQDPDRPVSNAALWALGQIGGTEARQALLDAYEDADRDMQAALDDAIAEQSLADGEIEFTLYDTEALANDPGLFDLIDPIDDGFEYQEKVDYDDDDAYPYDDE
jgi:HEAT repeat protein